MYSDFEKRVGGRLNDLVAALPSGTANVYLGADPSVPGALYPYFRITPTNPKSATIRGYVIGGQGLDFTIGQATGGEIFAPDSTARSRANEDQFFQICQVVFTSSLTEYVTYSSRGRVIRSKIVLQLGSRSVRLGGHQLFWWAVLNRSKKNFHYEPYY
jgi:hypothetical protein